MRRLSAILLLIPLGILFIGAVNLSTVCPITPQSSCKVSNDHCCHKGKCTSKSETRKDQKTDRNDHKTDRKDHKTDRSACCFDCPLCALVTIPPFIHFDPVQPSITIEYAVSPDNSLTEYDQPHWKPPDTGCFS